MSINEVNLAQGFSVNYAANSTAQIMKTLQGLFEGNAEITQKIFDDLSKYCQKVDRQIQLSSEKEQKQEAQQLLRELRQQVRELQITGNRELAQSINNKIQQLEDLIKNRATSINSQGPISLGEGEGFNLLDGVDISAVA
jgi:DNA phosphorothioation-dependent restriction protein DptG